MSSIIEEIALEEENCLLDSDAESSSEQSSDQDEHIIYPDFSAAQQKIADFIPYRRVGRILEIIGMNIKAQLPYAQIGTVCDVIDPKSKQTYKMEVIGFKEKVAILTSLSDLSGISNSAYIVVKDETHQIEVGEHLVGGVYNGLGEPVKNFNANKNKSNRCSQDSPKTLVPLYCDSPDPLDRGIIDESLSMGVKAIDSLLTCGNGQRIGIFAGAGVGKTTLLTMLARNADVDITVMALIGERGRELNEFLSRELDEETLKKCIVIVSTSDRPPMERAKAAYIATAISEYFRSQGKKVLLLMDSLTRFARAYREIGLSAGEPPTRRGFPPSVFSQLAKLLERTGLSKEGSITAFYTVLIEADDMNDPIADEVRSILDGHIVLSREIAEKNRYPAIDILASTSRVMNSVVSERHAAAAGEFKKLLAKYNEIELLVNLGEYKKGNDAVGDKALNAIHAMHQHLCQSVHDVAPLEKAVDNLIKVVS